MDAESADRVEATVQVGAENGSGISSQHTETKTAWANFKTVLTRRQTIVVFVFLGGLCFCAGVAVYFATMHNVSLVE